MDILTGNWGIFSHRHPSTGFFGESTWGEGNTLAAHNKKNGQAIIIDSLPSDKSFSLALFIVSY